MAKVSKSAFIGVISGSLGGATFKKGKDGTQVVTNKIVKTTNPSSAGQSRQRSSLALLSKAWYQTLTAGNRALWNTASANGYGKRTVAPDGSGSIIHGNTGRGGGKGLFIYCNNNVLRQGGTMLTVPVPGAVIPPNAGAAPITCTGGVVSIAPVVAPATPLVLQAWCQGAGKIPHRQILTLTPPVSPSLAYTAANFKGAKGASNAFSSLVGSSLNVQTEVIDPTSGLGSNPGAVVQVVIA